LRNTRVARSAIPNSVCGYGQIRGCILREKRPFTLRTKSQAVPVRPLLIIRAMPGNIPAPANVNQWAARSPKWLMMRLFQLQPLLKAKA